ncbi:MAG: hypothetical protein CM15mP68_3710 [Pseudomonadota bacterium]|nr:MAG: hypothetical protein CM15mP68_3710 [Pseudomonadota bacterium]
MCRSIALRPIQFEFVSIAATISNQGDHAISQKPHPHARGFRHHSRAIRVRLTKRSGSIPQDRRRSVRFETP